MVYPKYLGITGVDKVVINIVATFHLIPQRIGVFVDHDSYLDSFELACELHSLKQQVTEYVIEEALKEQQKMTEEDFSQKEALFLDPNTPFGDKFEAVMLDLLEGNNSSQLKPDDYQTLVDHGESEENPTNDF